mgnify:FL=1
MEDIKSDREYNRLSEKHLFTNVRQLLAKLKLEPKQPSTSEPTNGDVEVHFKSPNLMNKMLPFMQKTPEPEQKKTESDTAALERSK